MNSLVNFIIYSTQRGFKTEFEAEETGKTFTTKITLSKTHKGVFFKDEYFMSNVLLEQQGELALTIVLKEVLYKINQSINFYDYSKNN